MPIETLTDRAHRNARDLDSADAIARNLALLVEALERLTAEIARIGVPAVPPSVTLTEGDLILRRAGDA